MPRSLSAATVLLIHAVTILPATVVLTGTAPVPAAENRAAANLLELETERIIVFKDGYFLVIKRGKATTDDDGAVYTNEVPDAAVLGTYWATSEAGGLKNFISGWVEEETETTGDVPCIQTLDILKANESKGCSVRLTDESSWDGVIREVLTQQSQMVVPESMYESLGIEPPETTATGASSTATVSHIMSGHTGTHFVLGTEEGEVLLPVASVAQLTIDDMRTSLERTITTHRREKRLTFYFDEAGVERDLVVMYFRPGVRWIPTYRLALADEADEDKQLTMDLQAELLNEAEDLLTTPVDIVVGVPNFRFRSLPSPLSLEQTLRNTLAQAAPQLMNTFGNNGIMSNSVMTQQVSASGRPFQNVSVVETGGIDLPPELTTASSQDLFVYQLPNMSIRRTERAAVPILSTEVSYQDVYTWDVHLRRNDVAAVQTGAGMQSPLQLSENKVWRQIVLSNGTDIPWTTGAAMIMLGQQPLAQELLTYTSAGDACRIPVTVAVDLRGRYSETETSRKLRALEWGGYHYTKVEQRASLQLVNRKSVSVDVEIALRFGGRVDNASHEGQIEMAAFRGEDWSQYRGDPSVNNSSNVYWQVTLQPGEAFEPQVDYHFYSRQ